jgi:hypothetical protein
VTLPDRLYESARSSVDDKTTEPDSLLVEQKPETNTSRSVDHIFNLRATWWVEEESALFYMEDVEGESEVKHDTIPARDERTIAIDTSSKQLWDDLTQIFRSASQNLQCESGVEHTLQRLSPVSRETGNIQDGVPSEPPTFEWEPDMQGTMESFSKITWTTEIPSDGQGLFERVVEMVRSQTGDETVTADSIENVELLFDDCSYCQLNWIAARLQTTSPHLYYSGVSSYEEFVKHSSDERETTLNSENNTHQVHFRLPTGRTDNPSEEVSEVPIGLVERAENLMENRIESLVSVDGPYTYEAESVCFSEHTEQTTFYLRQYFDV